MNTPATEQARVNAALWQGGDHVATYAHRRLLPVEVMILVRYREALSGRVLELGCGAGRILGYLVALGGDVKGIDVSPAMVEHCRRVYPEADVRIGDLTALSACIEGRFDAIVAADNVLDVLDDSERRRVLRELRELITPGGLLIFGSHNLAYAENRRSGGGPGSSGWSGRGSALLSEATSRPIEEMARIAFAMPRRIRNRRRMARLERRAADHAIINDQAHDYALLHYYIARDDQDRQLADVGYELIECLDVDGRRVEAGEQGGGPWLHYIARPV
jgi:SAM-dependent methyltransferase